MNKKAWPINQAPEYDEGSDKPTVSQDSQDRYAALAYGETINPATQPPSTTMTGLSNSAKDKKKSCKIDVINNDQVLASFMCDIAKSLQEKVMGLQGYDDLSENAGLVFEYPTPEDVVYHMGTVKFPIDIVFIDDNKKIKKIERNIQPGTLGTFGCSGVKNVLEIYGGLSDRLGLCDGQLISMSHDNIVNAANTSSFQNFIKFAKDLGVNKSVIIKYSNLMSNKIHHWNGFTVVNVKRDFVKTAQKQTPISDLVSSLPIKRNLVHAFDFDGVIEKSPNITLYKTEKYKESDTAYVKLSGHATSIVKKSSGGFDSKQVHIKDFLEKNSQDNYDIILGHTKSLSNFLNDNVDADTEKILQNLNKACSDRSIKPIIITRFENPKLLRDIILTKYNLKFGSYPYVEIIKFSEDADALEVADFLRNKYGNQEHRIFSDATILKRSGSAISNEVKQSAKEILQHIEKASDLVKNSLDNMKKNLAEYTKFPTPEKIKDTKGVYNQSVSRNKDLFRDMLINVKESIILFDKIKDVSTTIQLIEALTTASKNSADSIEEIFALIEQMDSPEFINLLTQKTSAFERTILDLNAVIEKCKKYITKDILGIIVLSD